MLVNLLDQGGFCNRLTHAAAFLTVAAEYNFRVVHSPLARYKKNLPAITGNILCLTPHKSVYSCTGYAQTTASRILRSYCKKFLRSQSVRQFATIPKEYSDVSLSQDAILKKAKHSFLCFDFGWPVAPEPLVEKHKDAVLQLLQFPASDTMAVQQEFASIKKSKGELIGLHIRRGDYQNIKNGQYFWEIEQYKELAKRITQNSSNRVIICSNEQINPQDWDDLPVHYFPPDQIKDIIRLASCDFIVGPPSTFSAWAAFTGKKPIAHLQRPNAAIKFAPPQLMGSLE